MGTRDLHGIRRRQLGAGAVQLGDEAEAVGQDDDVVIVRHEPRNRRGDRLGVLTVGRDTARVLHPAEQDGAGIEGRSAFER